MNGYVLMHDRRETPASQNGEWNSMAIFDRRLLLLASPALAERAVACAGDKAPTYAERWSDHSPVVVDYAL